MSEDRLEKELEEMKQEAVSAATIEALRPRVRDTLPNAPVTGSPDSRPDFTAYLGRTLTSGSRYLIEDHNSRCSACRTVLAEMKGERRVIAMPKRSSSRRQRWGMLATA